jgi:hypothetical protein
VEASVDGSGACASRAHDEPDNWNNAGRWVKVFARAGRAAIFQGVGMYAIVFKSDGFPVCRQVPGVTPDPVVTWSTESAARAFISAKGAEAEFQPVELTDEAQDRIAQAMGCAVQALSFEPYPAS